jgi:hypothetical protein
MTDKEAFNEFARGFAVALATFGVMILFITMITPDNPTPEKKFEVVDRYDGQCDVVRYTDRSSNWHYFLDCRTDG